MLLQLIKNLRLNAKAAETEQQQEQVIDERTEVNKPQAEKPATPVVKPQTQPVNKPQTEKPAAPAQPSTAPVQPSTPPAQPPPAQPSTPPVSTPPVKPVETRDRSIYFIRKVNDNAPLVLVQVNRKLNVSSTPLQDSINALLAGPAPDEIMRGIESRVPEGSRLLSTEIKGTTAVLNFNKEFTYSHWGREGFEFQIKQIVLTATEFPNVKDVQFLIDGKIVDFLSEGVKIRNPIDREQVMK